MKLSDILASQASLLKDASEALPHQFSQCTHSLGYIRQAVYLCKTCSQRRGICSACSIACHTDHEQLELFPKRRFRCDCPTSALAHPCSLHRTGHGKEEANSLNEYGQNFDGVFCRCGREYDAEKEIETMIQCLACEVRVRNVYPWTCLTPSVMNSGLVSRIMPQSSRTSLLPSIFPRRVGCAGRCSRFE